MTASGSAVREAGPTGRQRDRAFIGLNDRASLQAPRRFAFMSFIALRKRQKGRPALRTGPVHCYAAPSYARLHQPTLCCGGSGGALLFPKEHWR